MINDILPIYQLSLCQKLLLQATLLQGEHAMQAWDCWQSLIDIENLDPSSNILLPQLYKNLLIHDVKHPYMARLKGIYRRNWYANQLRLKDLKITLSYLKDDEIDVIILGKASFGSYPIENCRSIDSFRLLVQEKYLEKANQKLTAVNWQEDDPTPKTLIHLQGHLFWAIPQDHIDNLVWHNATPDWSDRLGWRLSVTDQFLDSCTRTFFKGHSQQIYGIADVMILIQNSSNDIDWMRLVSQAQRYQMILPVRNMLIILQNILKPSVPNWVLPALWQMPIAHAEWLSYKILADDKRSFWQSIYAHSVRPLNYFGTKLRELKQTPFPGRQVLKSLLKPTKSAINLDKW